LSPDTWEASCAIEAMTTLTKVCKVDLDRVELVLAILIVRFKPGDKLFYSAGTVFDILQELPAARRGSKFRHIHLDDKYRDDVKRIFANAGCRQCLMEKANFVFSLHRTQSSTLDCIQKEIWQNRQVRIGDQQPVSATVVFILVVVYAWLL
jgi:hypothetical protein